jgi:hypothetical protein
MTKASAGECRERRRSTGWARGWDAGGVFERMTAAARQVAVQAQQEARGLAHDHVSSEHLLLGLLAVRGGGAARLLDSLGLSLVLVRGRVIQRVGGGDRDSPEVIPFNPRAQRIIALAVEEALKAGDERVGTEHILLAVVEEREAVAAGILRDLSIDPEHVRRLVRQAASSAKARSTDVLANPGANAGGVTAGQDGPRVTVREMDSATFSSAPELAEAFGSVVCEPGWWPADTEEVSYRLLGESGVAHYQIGSTRRGGVPILVVGHREAALAGRSPRDWLVGEWSEPPELADVRGLIGAVGNPPRLHGVVYEHGLQIQLIGYDTEAEIMRAVDTLCGIGTFPP